MMIFLSALRINVSAVLNKILKDKLPTFLLFKVTFKLVKSYCHVAFVSVISSECSIFIQSKETINLIFENTVGKKVIIGLEMYVGIISIMENVIKLVKPLVR